MKRLTMSQVAKANLRYNKKAYFSLAIGIFLAVYLACTAVLCIDGTLDARNEQSARKVGWADTILFNSPNVTDDQIRSSNLFEQLGHIYVTASIENTDVYTGYYDETADKLMYRQCVEGRMPEKAGEIAAERSALDKLGLESAALGDTFTWTMQPFDGNLEKRTYTLVGILSEQTAYLNADDWFSSATGTVKLPEILVSPDEPAYQVGGTVVHRVMTNKPLVTWSTIYAYENGSVFNQFCSVSRVLGRSYPYEVSDNEVRTQIGEVVLYLILGGALLLTTCVAIASAMESMLAQKTQDIGMLRAVGATKKQIRRLFGRDAWMLSLATLPPGIVLGCLTCWLLALAMPAEMSFRPEPWLILPVAAISFLCVFVSSTLPLRRASRQLPMSVLRDTDTLRKGRRFKSRTDFKGTKLIASRQFRLHPLRQAGSICMVALMLFITTILGEMLLAIDWSGLSDQDAFTLSSDHQATMQYESFATAQQENAGLTPNDMAQLCSLPMVDRLTTQLNTHAILLLPNEVPAYFKAQTLPIDNSGSVNVTALDSGVDTHYLEFTEEPAQTDFEDEWDYYDAIAPYVQMRSLQKVLNIQQKVVPVNIIVATLDMDRFSKSIIDGDIDLASLDAGQEVLVHAPNIYAKHIGNGRVISSNDPYHDGMLEWDVAIQNDYFYVGQQLSLIQLFGETPDWLNSGTDEGQLERYYGGLKQTVFTPKVGAVIKNAVDIGISMPFGLCLITTEKGAQALGLNTNGMESVGVKLSSDPDIATEEMLESSIFRIGIRRNMTMRNLLAAGRETRAFQMQVLSLFGGMVLLFFAVSVSMQVIHASRRIRADERMIGTLRAVGADEHALLSCYRLPVIVSAIWGFSLAAVIYLLMSIVHPNAFPQYHFWLLAVTLPMAALNALCAMAGIRGQLHQVMSKSIIDNIKEL